MDTESKRRRIVEALLEPRRPGLKSRRNRAGRFLDGSVQPPSQEPIAIVGLAGYFPQSMSAGAFWGALDGDRSLIEEVPRSRFECEKRQGSNGHQSEGSQAIWGGFIPEIRGFDPSFFGILPDEAEVMDPRRRLLLMSVHHTLEDAGYAPDSLKGSRTGVYVAAEENEYLQLLHEQGVSGGAGFGQASSMIANQISYQFDFRGPSEFINAMCAGGAVAIHRAVGDLRAGEIRQAVVGAANLLLRPEPFVQLASMGQLASSSSVASFGKYAEGYLRAEGVASLFLKPVSQAEADGDSIYAVIRNSAVNFNGREGMSISAPNTTAHTELVHRCYEQAGIDPRDIEYIEAQGMANPATDIAEWEAFNRALKQLAAERGVSLTPGQCGVSTLKPVTGHMHAASAMGALFKIIRSFRTNRLHGILGFGEAHPELDTRDQPCRLLEETRTWPDRDRPRLAGLHSYSSGGTNAHLLVEEYVARPHRRPENATGSSGSDLILLSARSAGQLREMSGSLRSFVLENPSLALSDLAYTLQVGRDAMSERLAILAESVSELLAKLDAVLDGGDDVDRCWMGSARDSSHSSEIAAAGRDLDQLAESWVQGHPVDWQGLHRNDFRHRLHLPTYPFASEEFWFEKQRDGGREMSPPRFEREGSGERGAEASEAEQFVNRLSSGEIRRLISEFQSPGNDETGESGEIPEDTEIPGKNQITAAIREVLTGTLRIDSGAISPSKKFAEYGLDSINGTKFIQALEESLDVTIPPKWMFEYPSIERLSRIIHRSKEEAARPADRQRTPES